MSWQRVTLENVSVGVRFLLVMQRLDSRYCEENPLQVVEVMAGDGCRYYLLDERDYSVALGLQWSDRRCLWQVRSVGFAGSISVEHALDAAVVKLVEVSVDLGVSEYYFLVPHGGLESPRINALHREVPGHPLITVVRQVSLREFVYWRLRVKVPEQLPRRSFTTLECKTIAANMIA